MHERKNSLKPLLIKEATDTYAAFNLNSFFPFQMKVLATFAIVLFTIQLSLANDVQTQKQCKDFFPESVSRDFIIRKE